MASTSIKNINSYEADDNLASAEKRILWVIVIGWIIVILAIGGLIALFTEGEEVLFTGEGSTILTIVLYAMIFLVAISGVFASIAATAIAKSATYKNTGTIGNADAVKAYDDCVIAAVASLGSLILTMIVIGLLKYEENRPAQELQNIPNNPIDSLSALQPSILSSIGSSVEGRNAPVEGRNAPVERRNTVARTGRQRIRRTPSRRIRRTSSRRL